MWEETRNVPLHTFKWGVDGLHDVKFNPVQKDLLGIVYITYMKTFYYIFYYMHILSSCFLRVQN